MLHEIRIIILRLILFMFGFKCWVILDVLNWEDYSHVISSLIIFCVPKSFLVIKKIFIWKEVFIYLENKINYLL